MGHSNTGCTWCKQGRKERKTPVKTDAQLKEKQTLRYLVWSLSCVKLLAKARELLYQFSEEATLPTPSGSFQLAFIILGGKLV